MHSNKGTLTNIEKLDYFVSWFGEFSHMEKNDFLEIYAKKYNDKIESGNGNLTFGFKELEINDRLPSIFKVRIQLFEQWFNEWTDCEKDQLKNRITNLDGDFVEKLDKVIESGKLPANSLLFASYEISDEMYEELRKNQLTNGNSLNSISSIDLLNTSNGNITNDCITINALNGEQIPITNGNGLMTNGRKEEETSDQLNSIYQNGYSNGHRLTEHSSLEQEDENNEDSINNQTSSLEIDNDAANINGLNNSVENNESSL